MTTQAKTNLMEKIEKRMDRLETQLKAQEHITNPAAVRTTIKSITKFWAVMEDEDKDYVHFAQDALEEQREWKV